MLLRDISYFLRQVTRLESCHEGSDIADVSNMREYMVGAEVEESLGGYGYAAMCDIVEGKGEGEGQADTGEVSCT